MERDKVWLEELYETDTKLWEQESSESKDPEFPDFKEFRKHYFGVTDQDREKYPGIRQLTSGRLANKEYDVIFGCVDNKYTRLWLNNFAIDNKMLNFGKVAPGFIGTRYVNISHPEDALVTITPKGEFTEWIYISPNNFQITGGENERITFVTNVPEFAMPGNYSGSFVFCFDE